MPAQPDIDIDMMGQNGDGGLEPPEQGRRKKSRILYTKPSITPL
jgi:hypothetical protein